MNSTRSYVVMNLELLFFWYVSRGGYREHGNWVTLFSVWQLYPENKNTKKDGPTVWLLLLLNHRRTAKSWESVQLFILLMSLRSPLFCVTGSWYLSPALAVEGGGGTPYTGPSCPSQRHITTSNHLLFHSQLLTGYHWTCMFLFCGRKRELHTEAPRLFCRPATFWGNSSNHFSVMLPTFWSVLFILLLLCTFSSWNTGEKSRLKMCKLEKVFIVTIKTVVKC